MASLFDKPLRMDYVDSSWNPQLLEDVHNVSALSLDDFIERVQISIQQDPEFLSKPIHINLANPAEYVEYFVTLATTLGFKIPVKFVFEGSIYTLDLSTTYCPVKCIQHPDVRRGEVDSFIERFTPYIEGLNG